MIINFRSCPLLEIIRWLFHSIYTVDLAQNAINMFLDLYTMKFFGSAVWIYKHWCSLKNVRLVKFYIIKDNWAVQIMITQYCAEFTMIQMCSDCAPHVLFTQQSTSNQMHWRRRDMLQAMHLTCETHFMARILKHYTWWNEIMTDWTTGAQVVSEDTMGQWRFIWQTQDYIHVAGLSLLSSNVCSSFFLL